MNADTKRIDLGSTFWYQFTKWDPDIALNPKYAHLVHLIRTHPRIGAVLGHKLPSGADCVGSIKFKTPLTEVSPFKDDAKWTVECWDPLSISPSILCGCGAHGYIKQGRWTPA